MKICHITTYWPTSNYGHTHYTENLMRGMRAHRPEKHFILAAEPAAAVDNEEYRCIPCFRSGGDFVEDIAAAAQQVRPDITIIQNSPDLFGFDDRLPRLVGKLARLGAHPVVNSHSIYPEQQASGCAPGRTAADFDRALAAHAALLSVHSDRMKSDLLARGVSAEKVVVLRFRQRPDVFPDHHLSLN